MKTSFYGILCLCMEFYHYKWSSFYGIILCFMHGTLSLHEDIILWHPMFMHGILSLHEDIILWHHMFYAWNIIIAKSHHFMASFVLCMKCYHCKKSSFYGILCFMHGTLPLQEVMILWHPTFYAWNVITARSHHFMASYVLHIECYHCKTSFHGNLCFMHRQFSLQEDFTVLIWNQ